MPEQQLAPSIHLHCLKFVCVCVASFLTMVDGKKLTIVLTLTGQGPQSAGNHRLSKHTAFIKVIETDDTKNCLQEDPVHRGTARHPWDTQGCAVVLEETLLRADQQVRIHCKSMQSLCSKHDCGWISGNHCVSHPQPEDVS